MILQRPAFDIAGLPQGAAHLAGNVDVPPPTPDIVPPPPAPHPVPPVDEPEPPQIIDPPVPGQQVPVRDPRLPGNGGNGRVLH